MRVHDARTGGRCSPLVVQRIVCLALLLLPDYGFTRGQATQPRQVQYFACRYFPDCSYKPVRDYKGNRQRTKFPICPEHGEPMDLLVTWKPRG